MSTLWQKTERRVARSLGLHRVSQLGKSGPDLAGPWLCVEVKTRRVLPKWIGNGLDRASAQASISQVPILVLHERGSRDDMVVMRLSVFTDWFGGPRDGDPNPD